MKKYNDLSDPEKVAQLFTNDDIKSLVHSYNSFSDNSCGWWDDRLEWRNLCLARIIELLAQKNVHITDNFFDDSTFEPATNLIIKKDKESKKFQVVQDVYDLEADMLKNEQLKEAAKDDEFARALYAALCNVYWVKNGIAWSCSWRYAGGVVADIRQQREDYIDFYCSGNEGNVDPRVAAILLKDGWTPKTLE